MDRRNRDLDRLLRAARAGVDERDQAPFGFETRVVARWRDARPQNGAAWELGRLFRRIALGATIVASFASAGAFWQLKQNDELDEPEANAYALADSLIEAGTWQ
ncbi:MAG: hypothetical protein M3Q89_00695 [Verrucomicrobiota bacterium]|nr:hypothetical protein [Verrucomicrobiota bacterium]